MKGLVSPFELDLRSLAVFRILLGIVLFVDLLERSTTLPQFYTDDGLFPRSIAGYALHDWRISIHMANGEGLFQGFLFVLAACAALSLAVGYRTRLATLISLVLLVSLHNRNPFVLYGADTMLRAMLFWAMFLPLGHAWSIDACEKHKGMGDLPVSTHRFDSIGTACYTVQLAIVYLFSAALKTDPIWREDHTAVEYALRLRQLGTPLGLYLADYGFFTTLASRGTLILEGVIPWFMFVPVLCRYLRLPIVLLFLGFHIGLAATMAIGLFPYVAMVAWTALIPGCVWNWFGSRMGLGIPTAADSVCEDRQSQPSILSAIGGGIAIAAMGLVIWVNLTTIWDRPDLRRPLNPLLYSTQIRQHWNMFAPKPLRVTRWYVVEVWTTDGMKYDGLRGFRQVDESPPEFARDATPSVRWRKFLNAMRDRDRDREWQAIGRYFAIQGENRFGEDTVEMVVIKIFQQRVLLGGEVRNINPETLYRYSH